MSSLRDKIKKEQEEQRKLREEGRRRMEEHRNRSLGDTLRESAEDEPLFGTRGEDEDPAEARARSKAERAARLNTLADRINPPAEESEDAPDTEGFRPTTSGRPTSQTNEMEQADLAARLRATNSIPPGSTNTTSETPATTTTPPVLKEDKKDKNTPKVDPWEQLRLDREQVKKDLKTEKDNLAFREAIESIANGLGKIGAGMYGNKVGTDMSGLKFDSKDWDGKRGLAQKEYQIDMADVSERRKEQLSKENNAADTEYRNKVLKETERHNKEMEGIGNAKVTAAGAAAIKKADSSALAKFKKTNEEISAELYDISKNLESDSISEDVASERIKSILQNKLDLSPEQAEEIVVDKGWFSFTDNIHDISEIQSRVTAIAVERLGAAEVKANSDLGEGEVAMSGPDGQIYRVAADQADAYAAEGYKKI